MTDSMAERASAAFLMPRWMIEAMVGRETWVGRYAMLAGIPLEDAGAVYDRIAAEAVAHSVDKPISGSAAFEQRLQAEYRRVMRGET